MLHTLCQQLEVRIYQSKASQLHPGQLIFPRKIRAALGGIVTHNTIVIAAV